MTRRLLIWCGALLAAGVLLNVVVALCCSILAQWRPGPVTPSPPLETEALAQRHVDAEPPPVAFGGRMVRVGYQEFLISAFGIKDTPRHLSIMDVQAGLPVRSLRLHRSWDEDVDVWIRRQSGRGLVVASTGSSTPILPLTPIWTGFAVNSVAFAALLLLIAMPWLIRRFARGRRGLCLRCGYPMGGGPVCSECGRPPGA